LDAIAADLYGLTRLPGDLANPAILFLTIVATAVTSGRVAVVALFVPFDSLVATELDSDARLAGEWAVEARTLYRAGCITAVVVRGIAVVAHLAGFNAAIATAVIRLAGLPLDSALEMEFELAGSSATIARHAVAVVAVFRLLIDLTVATCRR